MFKFNGIFVYFHISILNCSLATNVNLPPNPTWRCIGCAEFERHKVFNVIHYAIHKEPRNVYTTLNMKWLDRVLDPTAKVMVKKIDAMTLDSFIHEISPSPMTKPVPISPLDEEFHFIYATVQPNMNSSRISWSQKYPGITVVDHFLAQNPCWIPLSEPYDIEPNSNLNPNQHRRGHHRDIHSDSTRYNTNNIILVRLPNFSYHDTCQLYTAIHHIQFPKTCSKSSDAYMTHCVNNIGWSNAFNQVLFYFANSLRVPQPQKKIVVIPTPAVFHSNPKWGVDSTGKRVQVGRSWYWAEPSTCPTDIEEHDTWACNFLPLTHCNSPGNRKNIPSCPTNENLAWETPTKFLESNQITKESRSKWNDAPHHSQELWVYTRLMAYIQRPNNRLRYFIKKSISRLEPILSNPISHPQLLRDRSKGLVDSNFLGKPRKSRNIAIHNNAYKPCVMLHVRHGDLFWDARGNSGIDRSLTNFMKYTKNISESLGVNTIFLASDNGTLVSAAPYQYPEYLWVTQKRPIKYHKEMFDVNNEDDLQVELSHVLTEMLLATRCSAMVAAFDSGFSELIFLTMCGNSEVGKCPPSIDLREPFVVGHLT